jgi:hypothetical protein
LSRLFAYGSAMAAEELGPGARLLGPARLDDHSLVFRRRSIRWGGGAADLLPSPGGLVWGGLFEIGDWSEFDAREGLGRAYERITVTVDLNGAPVEAETYVVIEKEPNDVPVTPEYAATMLRGARACGLPDDYVAALERRLGA